MHRGAAVAISVLVLVLTPTAALAQASDTVTPQDQVVLRGDVVVPRGQSVAEIVVFSGSATVAGVARGDVVVLDGPITISGQVGGDVIAVHGRVRLVEPLLVIEVAFDRIQPSPRHKSGYALRFPRIVRLREDKRPGDINTLDDVRAIAEG